MIHETTRIQSIVCILSALLSVAAVARGADDPPRTRRVLYNFDGDSCLSTKAGGKGPVPVQVDDVKRLIEEVAYEGSRVDTILVCINAQVMYYPTKVGTLRGSLSTPDERAKWPASEKQRFENLKAFFDAGVDPYAIMLDEAKRRGREALLTFRMNDDHGDDFLRTQFLVDHPDWRLGTEKYRGKGALDFGRDEVREYTIQLIAEAVRRYDCDGIELDFNRFPTFFKDGSTDERVTKMNSLVERVRRLLDDVGRERKRRLVLTVRPPSNYGRTPPTPESARLLGCDVPAWVQRGLVDFVSVSEFLFERGDLPLGAWKQAIKSVPVYGGIECTKGGGMKNLTADEYRHAATELIKSGADGVYLFNFFTSREGGEAAYEPPFEVLRFLGAPTTTGTPPPVRSDGWKSHEIRQLGDVVGGERQPAKIQIVTEPWNRVAAVPYLVYMPEKDRLLMLVSCDYPHHAEVLFSDDRGRTWSAPKPAITGKDGQPLPALGTGLGYLGNGNVLFYAGSRWFSRDYGQTWTESVAVQPTPDGKPWANWDPPLVERDANTGRLVRLMETGYEQSGHTDSQAFLRSSTDGGATWSAAAKIPQWKDANEVALLRAANGHLVAACRTIIPVRLQSETLDHWEGLGVSLSTDDGRTWSEVRKLFDWGRHHPSLVLLPSGDIVMTYVVRKGYVDSQEGFPQFGIEAVVSRDHGQTWDLDHRYLLHTWVGNRKGSNQALPGPQAWWASSQATSTVLLPDGNLLTAFGTGYRSQPNAQGMSSPRDVGLIQWRVNNKPVSNRSVIRDAAADSDLRNRLDPRSGEAP